jgi:hypothetical protein
METLKQIFYHYLIGLLFSASIILLIILFDYFFNGYFVCPKFLNFIEVCLISGVGFGLTHFASVKFFKS